MSEINLQMLLDSLRNEIQMLLRFQLAYDRIFKFDEIQKISRSEFVDRIIALKAIENDLLIRICKFADTNSRSIGLKKIETFIAEHKDKDAILKKFEIFRKSIHDLKLIRRNKQLAHLDIGQEDNDYQPRYDFRPIIKHLVETINLISEKEINYIWKDGSVEVFNLVDEVIHKPIKANKTNLNTH
jgi:hypothetical protein